MTMMADRGRPLTQTGLYSPLMMFNCKGYEPVDFVFSGGWKVESVSVFFHHTATSSITHTHTHPYI